MSALRLDGERRCAQQENVHAQDKKVLRRRLELGLGRWAIARVCSDQTGGEPRFWCGIQSVAGSGLGRTPREAGRGELLRRSGVVG
jgi:hypothetical protein